MDYRNYEEEEIQARILADKRRHEREAVRMKRRRRRKIRWVVTKLLPFCLVCLALLAGIGFGIYGIVHAAKGKSPEESNLNADGFYGSDDTETAMYEAETAGMAGMAGTAETAEVAETAGTVETAEEQEEEISRRNHEKYYADEADYTDNLPANALCTNGIYIDAKKKAIVMDRHGKDRIIPASMTKVLTLLVACEHITDIEEKYTVTADATWYSYHNDLSSVGFSNDEVVSVKDLLYGTILPSGGDAAMSLAMYVGGTHENFVDMMNEKVAQLGLGETTHMTNCVGLYDENHYSTCYDIAIIMMAAMDNELCRQVLSEHKYTTSQTPEHPQGIEISNWFLRRIEDKDCGFFVQGAKTGYVKESGYNAVSLALDPDGNEYILVTINSGGNWKCIYDHVRIYSSQNAKG